MMSRWQNFLNSLNTPGGNLFAAIVMVFSLLGLLLHILHHGDTGQASSVIMTTFSGFAGALLAMLKGRSSDIPATSPTPMKMTETVETTGAKAAEKGQ